MSKTSKSRKERNEHHLNSLIEVKWYKNGIRILLFPLTQIIMAVGVFPAQIISWLKKTPGLKSIIGFVTRKFGHDSRSAAAVFFQDFASDKPSNVKQHSPLYNWFTKNPKKNRFAQAEQLISEVCPTPYKTDFGRTVFLETFTFANKNFTSVPEEQRYYRIHCSGNTGNCGRFFGELAQLSVNHPELKTITYNHPGVEGSDSLTMTQDDLVNALCAQVIHLLKQGVNPSHIELTGFSIGAATAALTAKKLQKYRSKDFPSGICVNLFCDRTLNTMPEVVTDKLPVLGPLFKFCKFIPLLKELVHYVIQPVIKWLLITPLLFLMNWNMNPAAAYKDIPAERKALTVVKPKTKGVNDSRLKNIYKYVGEFTGAMKEGNGDKTIAMHVALLSGVENRMEKKQWKENLQVYKNNNSPTTLQRLKQSAQNAIAMNAIQRLEQGTEDKQVLIHLAEFANKGRRLQGSKEKDAHNVTADNIQIRSITKDTEKKVYSNALQASGLPENKTPNLLTYYSIFHNAIKNNNEIIEKTLSIQVN